MASSSENEEDNLNQMVDIFGERREFSYINTSSGTGGSVNIYIRGIDHPAEERTRTLFVEHIWPGSIVLADFLNAHPRLVLNKSVIELGAGAGLPTLVADKLGASTVIITDYPDPKVLANIEELIKTNNCQRSLVFGHEWGENCDNLIEIVGKKFEVILMADVLWKDTYPSHRSLLKSIVTLLDDKDGIALLSFAHRPCALHSIENDLEFFQVAKEEFELEWEMLQSTRKYTDAMDNEEIEVCLYQLRFA
jgi:predicted nicotinamide N-methyase